MTKLVCQTNSIGGMAVFLACAGGRELRRVVGGGIRSVSQGRTGMYYDGQADRSDSDWLDGLQEPMRLDSQK